VPNRTSYNQRIVCYEDIHSIQQSDFDVMVAAAGLSGVCRVLDCGCGYGAVSRELINGTDRSRQNGNVELTIDLLDESGVQLDRAKQNLEGRSQEIGTHLRFIRGSFPQDINGDSCNYDVVICKMVIHEVKHEEQEMFVNRVYECLKKGGRFILWDLCLSTKIADFHRSVIRMKDALVGYETMVERRYLLTEGELNELFDASSFGGIEFVKRIRYRFETHKRLNPEFGGNETTFNKWQAFIRGLAAAADPDVLKLVGYTDYGDNICFNVDKVIAKAQK
jgi:SAM-dependent methyltransferase